jgi:hypothetical protein
MAVYVDELVGYGQAPKPGSERYFGNGKQSCHLGADTLEELHEFAARLGLKRGWFQGGRLPHYDLTPNKRAQAVRLGAVSMSGIEQARAGVGAYREVMEEYRQPNNTTSPRNIPR